MADPALAPTPADILADHERRLATLERQATPTSGIQQALVSTPQSTTSLTYTDLTTPGPSVTITVTAGQRYLVIVSASIQGSGLMAFEITGAGSGPPEDFAAAYASTTGDEVRVSRASLNTAGAAGIRVVTAKYRSGDGTAATFASRLILAIPL